MPKVRVLGVQFGDEGKRVQPSGFINLQEWAPIGEEMDLDEASAASMVEAGVVELVDGSETADEAPEDPAESADGETAEGKPVEKRPATKKAQETR